MKLGVENKKQVYALVGLGLVAAVLVYTQLLSGPSTPSRPAAQVAEVPGAADNRGSGPDISRPTQQTSRPKTGKNAEFHPVLRAKKKEDRIDPGKVDPTLRLDLLAKVMTVPPAGALRDLFLISRVPPVTQTAALKTPEVRVIQFVGPRQPPPPTPPPPPPPPPPEPPIPLKYYGYTQDRPGGKRTAYFLDNENNVLEAKEGTTIAGHYRVVTIGLDKVLIEDTQRNKRQSVNLEPEATG